MIAMDNNKSQALPHNSMPFKSRLRQGTALAGGGLTALFLTLVPAAAVYANPEDAVVVAGEVTIDQGNPDSMDISQGSEAAIIDWHSFSVDEGQSVTFHQPGQNAIILNRVIGGDESRIMGSLTANGHVMIINRNGVLFGENSVVDVAGLVATTSDIENRDFLAGNYQFSNVDGSSAFVINEGNITARDNGLVAFVAPSVANSGVIRARLGHAALAAGNQFTLDLYGDQLIQLAVDDAVAELAFGADGERMTALVANTGEIYADAGRVTLTAQAASGFVDSVINMSGHIQAQAVENVGGAIVLSGGAYGNTNVSGALDVSQQTTGSGGDISITGAEIFVSATARQTADGSRDGSGGEVIVIADNHLEYNSQATARGVGSGNGGFVETSGAHLSLGENVRVDTSADIGLYGTWSLDPETLEVVEGDASEDQMNAADIVTNLDTTNVELTASTSITVNAAIDSSSQSSSTSLSFIDEDADGSLTVNINDSITLGSNQSLSGEASTLNLEGPVISMSDAVSITNENGTINLAEGDYDLDGNQLQINTIGLTINGESEAGVTIDASGVASSAGAGIMVYSDGVTLQNLTIQGPSENTYGLKLNPTNDDENLSYTLSNITVQGSGRTEIDLLGVTGASLSNVTADGQSTGGVGIAITDSHDISLSGISTSDNDWGGIGLFTAGRYADGGSSNISLTGSNSISDTVPIYAEYDEDGGTYYAISDLLLEDFTYTVQNSSFRSDASEFTFFYNNESDAVDLAIALGSSDSVIRQNSSGSYDDVDGDENLDADGNFFVGNDGTDSMLIQTALDIAEAGDTIVVGSGSYSEQIEISTSNLSIEGAQAGVAADGRSGAESELTGSISISDGADGLTINGMSILEGASVDGSKVGIYVNSGATDITIENTIFDRSGDVDGDAYRGILTVSGGAQTDLLVQNNLFTGWATGVYINPGATGAEVLNNSFDNNYVGMSMDGPDAYVVTGNFFTNNLFEAIGIGPGVDTPSLTLSGNEFDSNNMHLGLWTDMELDLSGNSFSGVSASDLSAEELSAVGALIGDGISSHNGYSGYAAVRNGYVLISADDSVDTALGYANDGDVLVFGEGDYAYDLSLDGTYGLISNNATFDSFALADGVVPELGGSGLNVSDLDLSGGFSLIDDLTVKASGTVTAAGVNGGHSLTIEASDVVIEGTYLLAALMVSGNTVLTGDVTVDTSDYDGDITFTSELNGTTEGAEDLSLNAGDGSVSHVDLGQSIRIGDLTIIAGGYDSSSGTSNIVNVDVDAGDISVGANTLNATGTVSLEGKNVTGSINAEVIDIVATETVEVTAVAEKDVTIEAETVSETTIEAENVELTVEEVDGVKVDAIAEVTIEATNVVDTTVVAEDVTVTAEEDVEMEITAENAVEIDANNVIDTTVEADDVTVTAEEDVDIDVTADDVEIQAENVEGSIVADDADIEAEESIEVDVEVTRLVVEAQTEITVTGDVDSVENAEGSVDADVNGQVVEAPEPEPEPETEPEPEPEPEIEVVTPELQTAALAPEVVIQVEVPVGSTHSDPATTAFDNEGAADPFSDPYSLGIVVDEIAPAAGERGEEDVAKGGEPNSLADFLSNFWRSKKKTKNAEKKKRGE